MQGLVLRIEGVRIRVWNLAWRVYGVESAGIGVWGCVFSVEN